MISKMTFRDCTWDDFQGRFAARQTLHGVIDYWAERAPQTPAVLNATRGTSLTYAELRDKSLAVARALARLGFRKGDFLATSLPLTDDHIVLEYGCFRAGVIHVPLDLRLSRDELIRSLRLVGARGYATALPHSVSGEVPELEHAWDAGSLHEFIAKAGEQAPEAPLPEIQPQDGAQVIFTTGSTGRPKAALLTHLGITVQNYCLGTAFEFPESRILVNLPPSHVGCQGELLMTTFFWGSTAVTLEIFDPGKSLEAIEKYRIRLVGQIPAMFHMMWRHSEYEKRDLKSVEAAVYGGQSVPVSRQTPHHGAAHRNRAWFDGNLGFLHVHAADSRCGSGGGEPRSCRAGLSHVDPRADAGGRHSRRRTARRGNRTRLFSRTADFRRIRPRR